MATTTNDSKQPPLRVYDWRVDEYMAVDWYSKLVQSGDMAVTFTPDMRYLGNFLAYWRRAVLAYASDESGVFFACWVEPIMSGSFFGAWVREDKRHTVTALKLLTYAYDEAFKTSTVLIGLCKQEHLQDLHRKLGYKRACVVPGLWNGEDVDVYVMTRAMWEARHEAAA